MTSGPADADDRPETLDDRPPILKDLPQMPTIGRMHKFSQRHERSLSGEPTRSISDEVTGTSTGASRSTSSSVGSGLFTRLAILVIALATAFIGFQPGTPDADAAAGSFTITGKGWGHGVGMSQWGARGRAANKNENFRQILAHYYTGTSVSTGTVSNDIRVLTAPDAPSVKLKVTKATAIGGITVPAGATVTITRSGDSLIVSSPVGKAVASPLMITVGNKVNPVTVTAGTATTTYEYGTIRVDPRGKTGLRVIVGGLSMQQYLYGLGEMPMSWPAEALKSQIVAARTFAQKQINARRGNPAYADYDLNATLDGAYTGTTHTVSTYFTQNWLPAVNETDKLMITYGGALIDAMYSASSGGYTVDSETAFISALPYLRGVPDPDDLTGGNTHASWSATFTAAELGAWFGVGTMTSMRITGTIPASQHLDKTNITLTGTTGSKTVTGGFLRSTINSRAGGGRILKSSMFSIVGSTPAPAPAPAPTPAPNQSPTGSITVAKAVGRTIVIEGTAKDPNGGVFVQVVSTMGRDRAVRTYLVDGTFRSTWTGAPGKRNVCVTVLDNPTMKAVSLGCRDVVVK